jgi:hypothetical protein
MWAFKGAYSGEAIAYVRELKKKQAKIFSIEFSVLCAVIFTMMEVMMGTGELWSILVCIGGGLLTIFFVNLVIWIDYWRIPNCDVEIQNDGFYLHGSYGTASFAFYKIQGIEYYDDFIVIKPQVVLQKDLLIEGDWEALKTLLEKVEKSLETDNPMYQIEEPTAEFFDATVSSKRIYKRFVGEVRMQRAVYEYFVTFVLENGEEREYEVGQEWYEKIGEGETATLVLVNGNFFSFGEGEELE